MYDGEKAFQVLLYKQCKNVPKIGVAQHSLLKILLNCNVYAKALIFGMGSPYAVLLPFRLSADIVLPGFFGLPTKVVVDFTQSAPPFHSISRCHLLQSAPPHYLTNLLHTIIVQVCMYLYMCVCAHVCAKRHKWGDQTSKMAYTGANL